jgi:hypothetical protein
MRYVRRAGIVVLWAMQILGAAAFIAIGMAKFSSPFWVKAFARWGYSDGFRILIGVLEVAGGAALVWPRTTFYAAVLIDAILIGAAATLGLHGERMSAPTMWFVWISILAAARYKLAYGVRT